ncbi:S1 family peptidase [Pseudarthrobacter sp. PvP090]|uniref:S1 family peptidase n=1 Tax=Pseudarthrobacter sp. PvP090 TaxID=3156393 RepID=UPI00339097D3
MKTPKYQLTVRAVAVAALALAGSFHAVPAMADAGAPEPVSAASPSVAASPAVAEQTTAGGAALATATAPAAAPDISDAGLAEAVRRDLGMTLGEFNAAGQLGRTAADALPSLQVLPGYVGISLRDGKIRVAGGGAELQARVEELNTAGIAAEFVLAAPDAEPTVDPSTTPAAAPSAAPSAAELLASSTEQLFQAYVREVGTAGLQAVAYSGGSFIIRTGGTNMAEAGLPPAPDQQAAPTTAATAAGKISPAAFVARYANVELEQGSPVTTEADVFGGEGFAIDRRTICSTGFGAFSGAGRPVVLTAGHCAEDGTARTAELEPPASAVAGGSAPLPGTLAPLGSFGFSQFGGPNNSWITGTEESPGNVGTDIAVIEELDGGIKLQPAASTWADAANPGATAVKIIGTVAPFQGQEVCRSGRTEGWSCGQVEETGIYVAAGRTTAAADLRAFRGFLSKNVESRGGDSGGPWISGNFAVGTHSAGETSGEKFAIATTLEDALTKVPNGVQLQLFLNKPRLVAPEGLTVMAGRPIMGRVPASPASAVAAGSSVRITVDENAVEVPVDADGNWAYTAPGTSGKLKFTAETVNGFSRSGAVSLTVNVSDLNAPAITTPAEGAALNAAARIDGTGTPGLTVELTGDVSGSAVVGADGQWSIPLKEPAAGLLTIRAVQTSPGKVDSPATTRTFTVDAPVVAPAEPVEPTAAPTAAPSEPVPAEPVVTAAVLPAAPPAVLPAAPPAVLPAASGQLPDTGASSILPTAGLAGGALLLGGVLLAATRRRAAR